MSIVYVGSEWTTDWDGWQVGGSTIVAVFETEEQATAWRNSDGYQYRNGRGVTAVPLVPSTTRRDESRGVGTDQSGVVGPQTSVQ